MPVRYDDDRNEIIYCEKCESDDLTELENLWSDDGWDEHVATRYRCENCGHVFKEMETGWQDDDAD